MTLRHYIARLTAIQIATLLRSIHPYLGPVESCCHGLYAITGCHEFDEAATVLAALRPIVGAAVRVKAKSKSPKPEPTPQDEHHDE
jgi:hypothetical protein